MTDIVDLATRSRMMAGIRAKNTRPEILIRRSLHSHGLRYKLHDKSLPGRPDLVFPKYRAVIFVHGCFWHGHDCDRFRLPKTRVEFWGQKILKNRARDLAVKNALEHDGWRIAVIWECSLKKTARHLDEKQITQIKEWLVSDRPSFEINSRTA